MVRDFQSVVGYEARKYSLRMTGMMPDEVYACVGTGSNSIGMFKPFLDDPMDIAGMKRYGYGDQFVD